LTMRRLRHITSPSAGVLRALRMGMREHGLETLLIGLVKVICDTTGELSMTTLRTTVIMKTDIRGSTDRFRTLPDVDLDALLTEAMPHIGLQATAPALLPANLHNRRYWEQGHSPWHSISTFSHWARQALLYV
jgi:hypothetical protein